MRYTGLILLLSSALFGQSPDGLSTAVTRTVTIVADEADFAVVVTAPLSTSQQQVLDSISEAGVPSPSITAVVATQDGYTYPPPAESQVYYQLSFSSTPADWKGLAQRLEAFRSNLPSTITAIQYNVTMTASPAAIATAHSSVLPCLLADARAQAQTLAAAAGLKIGGIVGISESNYGVYSLVSTVIRSPVFSSSSSSGTGSTQYTFYASVRFAVQ
jgi:uncharacterized protein YggE